MTTQAAVSVALPRPQARARVRPVRASDVDVLLLDGQYRQSLAMMRSLSQDGLRVGALVCASDARSALALRSRRCRLRAVAPDFTSDPDGYADAVLSLLDEHPARVVVPCHDGSIETLRSRRAEFESRSALPLGSEAALDIATSKPRTLALAAALKIPIPRGVSLAGAQGLRAALNETGLPAVIKPTKSWVRKGVGSRVGCEIVRTVEEAERAVDALSAAGADVVVQQWLPGRRDAVTLFYSQGRVWARFAQTSHRELPLLGGASVLCESLPALRDLVEPAERLLRAMDLEGCSMVEFRRDRNGTPVLMEVNARLPGSVALAISCGVNFPALIYNWATGRDLQPAGDYRVGYRMRWLSGDLWNLKNALESAGHPEVGSRLRTLATFCLDFMRPCSLDVVDWSDMKPAFVEWNEAIIKPALGRLRSTLLRSPRRSQRD